MLDDYDKKYSLIKNVRWPTGLTIRAYSILSLTFFFINRMNWGMSIWVIFPHSHFASHSAFLIPIDQFLCLTKSIFKKIRNRLGIFSLYYLSRDKPVAGSTQIVNRKCLNLYRGDAEKLLKIWSMGINKTEWECGKIAQLDTHYRLV